MALQLKQQLRLSQDLVITPQLRQAIELLAMNRIELQELVTKEMVENPVLEEAAEYESTIENPEPTADPEAEQKRDEDSFVRPANQQEQLVQAPKQEDFNWESYIEEFNSNQPTAPSMREVNEDLPSFEAALTKSTTLEDHLLWQLSMTTLSDEERQFGTLVVGNLNDDGYLIASVEDLAKESCLEVEDAEEALKIIQNFDPIGCASRDLKECLAVQAKLLLPKQPLVEQVIQNHIKELERRDYNGIAKTIGVPLDQVIEATKLILEFEPKPGRSFFVSDTQYIQPDVYVYKVGHEYVIVLNEDGLPKLKISNYYKNILSNSADTKNAGTKQYVQDKLRSAMWLIRSIHRRQNTIFKVTESIVRRQIDFFEKGVQFLKPMVLKDVANEIGMHESTISRVTTNKYVHTPVGIFELKYFFNAGIRTTDGSESLASKAVKEKIRNMITKEDQRHPLSDQKIVQILRKEQIDIARRTVAKYREMMGILPSGRRKKIF